MRSRSQALRTISRAAMSPKSAHRPGQRHFRRCHGPRCRRLGPRLRRSPAGHHNGHPHRHPRPSARRRALLQRHRRPVDRSLERRRGSWRFNHWQRAASATPTPGRRASIWKPPSTLFRRLYGTSPRTASTTRSTTLLRHGEQDQRTGAGPRARLHLGRGSRRSRLH